tara:strand:+ start:9375 stop:10970 length:1596 start_codon:yes stop_codon:yes gene_type:complete
MARGTVDTGLVKQGYSRTAYTPDTLEDFKNCADPVGGPLYFMNNHVKIQHPTRGGIDFDPFAYQLDLIENYNNFRYSINMLGRQMGKTTVAAGYLLWYAMFKPDSTILVAAHKAAGAYEIMQRIRYAYESVPDHIRAGVTEYNKGSMAFDNGSRIVSATTTENTGRGMSLTLVYLDEFAFVPPRIASEFWTALSPTLATGGKCIITSTPNSDEDTFANIWNSANKMFDEHGNEQEVGVNGFKPLLAKWDEHPDRDANWAIEERGRIGTERFKREHECEFVIYDETLINQLKLLELNGINPIMKMGHVRWFKYPSPEHIYVVTLDPSTGTGGDNAAIQIVELPSMVQVGEWYHNKTPIEGQIKVMLEIMHFIKEQGAHTIYWTVENNAIGEAALVVIRDTGEDAFPGDFLHEPKRIQGKTGRRGFHTTHKVKVESCINMKRLIENDKLTINSKACLSEFKNFVSKGNSFSARPGDSDDLVMSMMIAVRVIDYVSTFEDEVYDAVNNSLGVDSLYSTGGDDDDYDDPMPIGII